MNLRENIFIPNLSHIWPALGYNNNHTGLSPYLGPTKGIEVWHTPIGKNSCSCPVISAEKIIVLGSFENAILGISSETGKLAWKINTDRPVVATAAIKRPKFSGEKNYNDSAIIGTLGGSAYCIEIITGAIQWANFLSQGLPASPIISALDITYIGGINRKISALHIKGKRAGKSYWKKPFETEGSISSSPALYNNTLFCGCHYGYIYAIDASNGLLKWKRDLGPAIHAPIVIGNNALYANCNGMLYAVSLNGHILWSMNAAGKYAPAIDKNGNLIMGIGDEVFMVAPDGPATMRRLCKLSGTVSTSPVVDPQGTIFLGCEDGLYAVSENGSPFWHITIDHKVSAPPSIDITGRLFFTGEDGYLRCVE